MEIGTGIAVAGVALAFGICWSMDNFTDAVHYVTDKLLEKDQSDETDEGTD